LRQRRAATLNVAADPDPAASAAAAAEQLAAGGRFTFRGDNLTLQSDPSPELVVSGPAGTGKSLACLWKLHAACARTANVRALILRKTRASLSESALVTFEQQVLPPGSGISDGPGRANRRSYRYPNGSEIIVGGIDDPVRIMSTDYDLIYVQEAIELVEPEWETVTTRLRNASLPYQQLIADTNPDRPTHWIKRRQQAGHLRLLESRHEDNPALHDGTGWTRRGLEYLAILDRLTGPRRDRLRYGRWVQAEGIVYDGYDARTHLIDPFPIPADWPRYWSLDFGFVNPLVWQFYAEDPEGRLYLYREIYRAGRLVEDHARDVLDLVGAPGGDWSAAREPRPQILLCDHDREDRATLERHLKMGTTAALKDRKAGVQAVAARWRPGPDGRPRLFIFKNALVERDPALFEQRRPTCTAEEIEGYVWDRAAGRAAGEEPIKTNDHGLDALRYLCFWKQERGPLPYYQPGGKRRSRLDELPPDAWGRDLQ
jgi:hypothetical protein